MKVCQHLNSNLKKLYFNMWEIKVWGGKKV